MKKMNEREITERIITISGHGVTQCNCGICQHLCRVQSCMGTPNDILRLINEGFKHRLTKGLYMVGFLMGASGIIPIVKPDFKGKSCVFFYNGNCGLHETNLKPLEGKLTHHTLNYSNYNIKHSVPFLIAQEWIQERNIDTIIEVFERMDVISKEQVQKIFSP